MLLGKQQPVWLPYHQKLGLFSSPTPAVERLNGDRADLAEVLGSASPDFLKRKPGS